MSSPSLVELKAILRLAGPLIAAQLAYVAMVFTDTVMMGKLGPDPPACCYGTCGRCSCSSARRRRRWTAPCSSSTA